MESQLKGRRTEKVMKRKMPASCCGLCFGCSLQNLLSTSLKLLFQRLFCEKSHFGLKPKDINSPLVVAVLKNLSSW